MKLKEDFCSYEVSKLLKEKGFPFTAQVGALWIDEQGNTTLSTLQTPITWEKDGYTPCVTHDLAMKWLREKGVYIIIKPFSGEKGAVLFTNIIFLNDGKNEYLESMYADESYAKAVEAAIKKAISLI